MTGRLMTETNNHTADTAFQQQHGVARARRNASVAVTDLLRGRPFKGAHRLSKFISRVLVPRPNQPIQVPTKHGFSITVDPGVLKFECIERSVYFQGGYEEGTLDVLKRVLEPGDVFIDVGGNIGLMTLAASQRVGERGSVYAFEPNPAVLPSLKRNVDLNQAGNVRIVERALGSAPGTAMIYPYAEVSIGSASLIPPGDESAEGTEIQVIKLDDFAAEEGIEHVKLIKADVEGWELEVFRGATELLSRQDAPALCFEYSRTHGVAGGTLEDLYRFILDVNEYRLFKLAKGKEIPSPLIEIPSIDDLPQHDNLFAFLPAHIEDGILGKRR